MVSARSIDSHLSPESSKTSSRQHTGLKIMPTLSTGVNNIDEESTADSMFQVMWLSFLMLCFTSMLPCGKESITFDIAHTVFALTGKY